MRPCAYSYVHARITKTQYHRTGRSPGWRRPPISGTAQSRAQEHRCRAGAVCSAVVTARFLKGILLSHASHACDHTHTPIHTHTANNRNDRSAPHTARIQHPPRHHREVLRRSSGAARKDSCTACERTAFTPCLRTHSAVDTRRRWREEPTSTL